MFEIDEIPENWTKDQEKIYEIYCEYFVDSEDEINPEVIKEFEKLLTKWKEESQIKIVSWNCNGKFREKFNEITEENADIYVIQECEDPAQSTEEEYREFAGEEGIDYIWTGHLHYKGLGIFAKGDINLEKLESNGEFEHFIPVRVNDSFNLLGVWAMPDYVEMIHDYFDANEEMFDENLVMCGDFNSNAIWDKKHGVKNQTELNKKLEGKNLKSVYHSLRKDEKQGEEKSATFYLTKHLNKPYYIDFVYAAENAVKEFEILDSYKWLIVSDHLPLVFKV
ncbi:MAG: hypothetical protein Q4Q14_08435 [Methanobrevibacter sp.]|nr:hypothetical protein [Methanobrevibacter sp.]